MNRPLYHQDAKSSFQNIPRNDFRDKNVDFRNSYNDRYSNPPISRYSSSNYTNDRGSSKMQSGNRGRDSKHSSSYRKRDSSNGRDQWRQNLYNNDQRKNPWFRDNQRNSSRESDFVEPDKFPNSKQASDQKLDIIKKDKKLIDKSKEQSPEKQNQIIINLSDI